MTELLRCKTPDDMFSCFKTDHQCDRHTDRQTDGQIAYTNACIRHAVRQQLRVYVVSGVARPKKWVG